MHKQINGGGSGIFEGDYGACSNLNRYVSVCSRM